MQTAFAAETNCFCVGRFGGGFADFEPPPPPPQAATTSGKSSSRTTRRTTGEGTDRDVEPVLGGRQAREDLAELRPAALALLREEELVVDQDVELALLARDHLRAVLGAVQLGHETRGPFVVPASNGAVEDA